METVTVIELLNSIEQRYGDHKLQYYALNKELEKNDGKLLMGEEFIHIHTCMIAMDDIFAEEINPIGEFVAKNFADCFKIIEMHEDLKKNNQSRFGLYTGGKPVVEPLKFEQKEGMMILVLADAFVQIKARYYNYGSDLKRLEHHTVEGETLQHLLRTFFEMDEFYCQELYPLLSFIANHYKESVAMAKDHYDFKMDNIKLSQEQLHSHESQIITKLN